MVNDTDNEREVTGVRFGGWVRETNLGCRGSFRTNFTLKKRLHETVGRLTCLIKGGDFRK